jgi:heme exporter protein D
MGDFLHMGGYGVFVWPAFIVSAAVLAGLAIESVHAYRKQMSALAALEARRPARK